MNAIFVTVCCISTMVITGSLIAGDSLRTSITHAAYENLGEVDEIVISQDIFNASLVDRLAGNGTLMHEVDHIVPLLYLKGSAGNPENGQRTVDPWIIGYDETFLALGDLEPLDGGDHGFDLELNEVVINENLAREIEVSKGDMINISFSRPDQSLEAVFLGDRSEANLNIIFRVKNIVKDRSLGRFQLNARRSAPENIYVPLGTLQRFMDQEKAINTILVSNNGDERDGVKIGTRVTRILKKAIEDVLDHTDADLQIIENHEKGYVKLESENVFLPHVYYEQLANDPGRYGADSISPVVTYFWNSLTHGNLSVPYSTITGFDAQRDKEFGLFSVWDHNNGTRQSAGTVLGELEENEIILNNWTAEQLQAEVGDQVTMNYSAMDDHYTVRYLAETFIVRHIVELEGKANDSMLMPSFPGIDGKTSALNWDPPFPIDLGEIRTIDEDYWDNYRGTPKAFVNLETGVRLWGNDIGNITQIRFSPADGTNTMELSRMLGKVLDDHMTLVDASLTIREVKKDALDAGEGAELFTGMFLAFSGASIIAASVLLVLLITLRMDSRRTEIGLLRSMGFRKSTTRNIILVEGTILAVAGGILGIIFGLVFGYFIITGMNTFWSPIVENSAVSFSFTSGDLLLGFSAGIIISIISMIVGLHNGARGSVISSLKRVPYSGSSRSGKVPKRSWFGKGTDESWSGIGKGGIWFGKGSGESWSGKSGWESGAGISRVESGTGKEKRGSWIGKGQKGSWFRNSRWGSWIKKEAGKWELAGCLMILCALIIMTSTIHEGSIMMLFFATGFMILTGLLFLYIGLIMRINDSLERGMGSDNGSSPGQKRWFVAFTIRNAARNPKRSITTVILFSLTLFVLVSLTVNLQGVMYDRDRVVEEGGGGYQIIGESTNPIFADLGDEHSREDLGIHSPVFDGLEVEQFRTRGYVGGTCSNLNTNADPRIIGANESFFHDNTFEFTDHEHLSVGDSVPWDLLALDTEEGEIPAIGDYNTIVWILGLELGSTLQITDDLGSVVDLKIVGIIGNSIFQGSLVIWEGYFNSLFPTNPGYSLFLFKSDSNDIQQQITDIEQGLTEYGFDASSVETMVLENIEVENTYIVVFQVLLIFAVIVGTLGVGVVVSMNITERHRELGLLRAMGFTRKRLKNALLMENSFVILSGILIGTLAGILTSLGFLARLNIDPATWPWLYVIGIILLVYGVAMISVMIPVSRWSGKTVSTVLRILE